MAREQIKERDEFVRLVYGGMSKKDAYRKAFNRPDMSDAAASKAASRVSKKCEFKEKVSKLDREVNAVAESRAIGTRVQRLQALWQIVEECLQPKEVYKDGEVVGYEKDYRVAIKAMAEINKMEGSYEPARVEVKNDIALDFVQDVMSRAAAEPLVGRK